MNWQDTAFSVGQLAFTLALLPSIYSNQKPDRMTCFVTASFLFLFGGSYMSLGLLWSAASANVCALAWSYLFFQKRVERRPFAWYDRFSNTLYFSAADVDRARDGDNEVVALFREER
jgi:hypothetical protein